MACRLIEPSSGGSLPDSRPSSIIVGALIRFIAGLICHVPLAGSGRRSGEIMIGSRELNGEVPMRLEVCPAGTA
jgi:hypothetical protein